MHLFIEIPLKIENFTINASLQGVSNTDQMAYTYLNYDDTLRNLMRLI